MIPKIPDQLDVDTSTVSNECHRNVCPGTSESIQNNVVHDQSEVSRDDSNEGGESPEAVDIKKHEIIYIKVCTKLI